MATKSKKHETQPETPADTTTQAAAPTTPPAAPAPEAAPKPPKDEKNGITRPQSGATRQVWEIADKLSAELGRPPTRPEVTEKAEAAGINKGTIHTQFGHWRKYYGLTTPKEQRLANLAAAREAKEAEKAKAKAEKEAKKAEAEAEKTRKAAEKAAKEAAKTPAPEAAPTE